MLRSGFYVSGRGDWTARLGGAETNGGGGGMLGGIAMATHRWQHLCTALSAAQGAGAKLQPAAALGAAPSRCAMGSAPLGSCTTTCCQDTVSPGSSLRAGGMGCLVQLLPSFAPHWGTGRQVLFAHLFCLKPRVAKQAWPERNWSSEPSR